MHALSNAAPPMPADTSAQGVAQILNLAPGRYDIRAEFSGFQPGLLPNVQLRPLQPVAA